MTTEGQSFGGETVERIKDHYQSSKAIVVRALEVQALVALEDLTGIREGVNKKAGRNQRKKVNGWAFYQL